MDILVFYHYSTTAAVEESEKLSMFSIYGLSVKERNTSQISMYLDSASKDTIEFFPLV